MQQLLKKIVQFFKSTKETTKKVITENIVKILYIKRSADYLPTLSKGTSESSGYDLIAYHGEYVRFNTNNTARKMQVNGFTKIKIPGNSRILVPTGIRLELPDNIEAMVRPRSGITIKTGLVAQIGTIDADYRGEIKVTLINTTPLDLYIAINDRIAQLVFQYKVPTVFQEVDTLTPTYRGSNGHGSTGK